MGMVEGMVVLVLIRFGRKVHERMRIHMSVVVVMGIVNVEGAGTVTSRKDRRVGERHSEPRRHIALRSQEHIRIGRIRRLRIGRRRWRVSGVNASVASVIRRRSKLSRVRWMRVIFAGTAAGTAMAETARRRPTFGEHRRMYARSYECPRHPFTILLQERLASLTFHFGASEMVVILRGAHMRSKVRIDAREGIVGESMRPRMGRHGRGSMSRLFRRRTVTLSMGGFGIAHRLVGQRALPIRIILPLEPASDPSSIPTDITMSLCPGCKQSETRNSGNLDSQSRLSGRDAFLRLGGTRRLHIQLLQSAELPVLCEHGSRASSDGVRSVPRVGLGGRVRLRLGIVVLVIVLVDWAHGGVYVGHRGGTAGATRKTRGGDRVHR